ncbi:MAG: restriction endonuclease subunit S [Lachnospiraceae bacterium]|nr:restriction endonuclease subunit S [Lachnospiraceae bacterium]
MVLSNFKNVRIRYPSIAEQKKIGDYFANLDHLITLHQRK